MIKKNSWIWIIKHILLINKKLPCFLYLIQIFDEGSIAEAQGIVAGDQIICVDGLPLMTATHKEAVAFISIRNKVCLLDFWTRL